MSVAFSRRRFLSTSLAAGSAVGLSALSYRRVLGANERIGIGFIGYGLIGKRHVADFKLESDVAGVDRRLANADFIAKADPDVIEENRERRTDMDAARGRLATALERLEAL